MLQERTYYDISFWSFRWYLNQNTQSDTTQIHWKKNLSINDSILFSTQCAKKRYFWVNSILGSQGRQAYWSKMRKYIVIWKGLEHFNEMSWNLAQMFVLINYTSMSNFIFLGSNFCSFAVQKIRANLPKFLEKILALFSSQSPPPSSVGDNYLVAFSNGCSWSLAIDCSQGTAF